jgi:type VI secretion system protein VasD
VRNTTVNKIVHFDAASRPRSAWHLAAHLLVLLTVSGCASTAGTVATVAKVALQAAGINTQELPESQKPPRKVSIAMSVGSNLNADGKGQPLSALMRIYKLKETMSFLQAPLDVFVTPGRDKALLGDDLVESRDVTLIPGQDISWIENVARSAGAVGIVVLFHTPQPGRWRFAFDAMEAEKTGIVMGAHACALTITRGTQLPSPGMGGDGAARLNQLVHVRCKA